MSEPLNNGKPLPPNAVAVFTIENGWEYLPDLVAQRDRYRTALEIIADPSTADINSYGTMLALRSHARLALNPITAE